MTREQTAERDSHSVWYAKRTSSDGYTKRDHWRAAGLPGKQVYHRWRTESQVMADDVDLRGYIPESCSDLLKKSD